MSQSFPPWRGLVFVSPSTSARTSRSSPAIHSNVHTALPAFSHQQGLTLSLDPQWSSLAYPSTLSPQNPSLPVLALCWMTVTNPSKPHCTGSRAIHFHLNLTKRKSGPEVGWWEGRKTVNFSPALSGQYSCSGWVSPWFLQTNLSLRSHLLLGSSLCGPSACWWPQLLGSANTTAFLRPLSSRGNSSSNFQPKLIWVAPLLPFFFLTPLSITSDMQMTPPLWQKVKKN